MRIRDLVRAGRGVVRWADLEAAGVTHAQLRAALDSGELTRIARGVYAAWARGSHVIPAVLGNGHLSHASAAAAWGLDVLGVPDKPHVLVPHDRDAPAGCHVHWIRRSRLREVTTTEPFGPMTTVARTLVDCGRGMPFREALVIVDSALRRNLITLEDVQVLAASLRGPGARKARAVLLAGDGRSDSVGETLVRAAAIEAGAPRPELQYRIALSSPYSTGLALADLAWPSYKGRDVKVLVEHDGFDAHGVRRETFDRDRERWNSLQDEGWSIRLFTWTQAKDRYEQTGMRIMKTLNRRHRDMS